jgi:hypothetical protein
MKANTTGETRFKRGVQYGLKHIRTRKKYFLLPQTKEQKLRNEKRRCSGCKKTVEALRPDRGYGHPDRSPTIAMHCPRCEVIFPAYRKVVSIIESL